MEKKNWYSEPLAEIARALTVDLAAGLSAGEAASRLERYGPNKLDEKPPRTFLQRFIDQMKDTMIVILLVAAAVSLGISVYHASIGESPDWIEPIVILLIVVINGVLGVMQESKAEAALDALKKMSMPQSKVRRDGAVAVVDSSVLVPGDVILLDAGDIVPADARIVEGASLKSDESALTGESVPVDKDAKADIPDGAPLGDRTNMLYSGNTVTYGRGVAIVVATGMETEMGHIATLIGAEGTNETPLQRKLSQLGKYLGIAALLICLAIFGIGTYEGLPLMEMFMTAISLAVAAIPEGLPAIVTIVLAMGVRRMVAKHAIIRRLPAVETLGSTSVICSDKTGTLTQNRMTVVKLYTGDGLEAFGDDTSPDAVSLIRFGTLCSDGRIEREGDAEKHIGDPTETAIVAAALRTGETKDELEAEHPRVGEVPFDSDRKLMTTVHKDGDGYLVIVKGAPDVLLSRCTSGDVGAASRANDEMSEQALRVLAVGRKSIESLPATFAPDDLERDLSFVGLIGMIDPPREEVRDSIAECDRAGIRTVMITGDHVVTASAIARELGILHDGETAITGAQLAALSEEELGANIETYRVYARVSPSDKIRIVKAWQAHGQIVAMTGDGVNDAPALKAADIGCAMGITGTEVSKGAADMILTDDNFATIVAAVREGRGIYDNIRKAVRFLLSCNLGEIVTVFAAMLLWHESPLLPIQILWINLVTDSFPALALGMEAIEPDIMNRKPRGKDESIFSGGVGTATVLQGLMIGILTLIAYYVGTRGGLANGGLPLGETMAFSVLAFSQLVQSFNVRSSHSLFKVGLFSNKHMVQAVLLSLALMLVILLVPFLRTIFKVIPMNGTEWGIVLALSTTPLFLSEAAKAVKRKA
ncbi:calcium-translocating P-type ATPase, PMCA-type [Synergistaceae bacterium OttesenSCG-928-I11]|nr:calcium-translocating P-type ATPase, PMCA-type [Synergistaceae bacterium OttesenSCG-928-I11]